MPAITIPSLDLPIVYRGRGAGQSNRYGILGLIVLLLLGALATEATSVGSPVNTAGGVTALEIGE